jgi:hypothetical protein
VLETGRDPHPRLTEKTPSSCALNEYRVRLGMKPLKSWSASRVALEVAIDKIKPKPVARHTSLPSIARELGINPKAARAKLRKSHGAAWKALTNDELRALIAAEVKPAQRPTCADALVG